MTENKGQAKPQWVANFRGSIDDVAAVARALGFERATPRNVRFYQNSGIVDPPETRLGRKGLYEVTRLTQFCAALSLRRAGVALEEVSSRLAKETHDKITAQLWTEDDPRSSSDVEAVKWPRTPTRKIMALDDNFELVYPAGMTEQQVIKKLQQLLASQNS